MIRQYLLASQYKPRVPEQISHTPVCGYEDKLSRQGSVYKAFQQIGHVQVHRTVWGTATSADGDGPGHC